MTRERTGVQWTRPVCRSATVALFLVSAVSVAAQPNGIPALEWRPVGNTTIDAGLASPAGGPVDRVWYSEDGQTTFVRTRAGNTWQTFDGEKWAASQAAPPQVAEAAVARKPEASASVIRTPSSLYAAGEHIWRSDDDGAHWNTLTAFEGQSILGGRVADVAVSPVRPEEITVAGEFGVWRSMDGGASWAGLNDTLPNLPAARILSVASDVDPLRIATHRGLELIWAQGGLSGWRVAGDSLLAAEAALHAQIPGRPVSAVRAGDWMYAGFENGRLSVSADRGRTWTDSPAVPGAGSIRRVYADERGPAFALAITGASDRARVLRTVNRGAFWDDITANLPPGAIHGITADRLTGAVYIATDAGVFFTYTDTNAAAPATPWIRLREEPARDVALDAGGNQLYVAFDGIGIHAAMAPHRLRDPRVVSAGDRVLRPVAPGSLLSVIGARVDAARAGDQPASVLAASDLESQVQLPMDLAGTGVMISMNSAGGRIQIGLPVMAASPSIFVDKDGQPLIMNADTGLMLDASAPARSRTRLQILVSGLGRTTPNWPVGLAAPLQDPPRVIAGVQAYLDREPLQVLRATLAPGYVGLYLVEVEVPSIVNRGSAEFYLEAAGQTSNRVRLWIEP